MAPAKKRASTPKTRKIAVAADLPVQVVYTLRAPDGDAAGKMCGYPSQSVWDKLDDDAKRDYFVVMMDGLEPELQKQLCDEYGCTTWQSNPSQLCAAIHSAHLAKAERDKERAATEKWWQKHSAANTVTISDKYAASLKRGGILDNRGNKYQLGNEYACGGKYTRSVQGLTRDAIERLYNNAEIRKMLSAGHKNKTLDDKCDALVNAGVVEATAVAPGQQVESVTLEMCEEQMLQGLVTPECKKLFTDMEKNGKTQTGPGDDDGDIFFDANDSDVPDEPVRAINDKLEKQTATVQRKTQKVVEMQENAKTPKQKERLDKAKTDLGASTQALSQVASKVEQTAVDLATDAPTVPDAMAAEQLHTTAVNAQSVADAATESLNNDGERPVVPPPILGTGPSQSPPAGTGSSDEQPRTDVDRDLDEIWGRDMTDFKKYTETKELKENWDRRKNKCETIKITEHLKRAGGRGGKSAFCEKFEGCGFSGVNSNNQCNAK